MSFNSISNQRKHVRYKTIDGLKFIKPIILNDYIMSKTLSSEKRSIDKTNQKVLINKKIGIPISPFSYYNSSKSRNLNHNIKKKNSDNISTSESSNKTKSSRIFSFSTTNINPFLIVEKPKIINKKNDLNINNKSNRFIQTNDIFHFKNYKTPFNKYSQIKPKITHQNKKKLGKLIFTEMNNKFYDSKISIKSSRDKSIENESIKIKQIIRFWKGVMDISYPKIIINTINTKYESNNNNNKKKNNTYSFGGIKI